jgi:hypothetical protein
MKIPYAFAGLKPVAAAAPLDEESGFVYDLPAAIPWDVEHYISPGNWQCRKEMITRVTVCLSVTEIGQPFAIVAPLGEDGLLHETMPRIIGGASSIVAVLSALGFEPTLESS